MSDVEWQLPPMARSVPEARRHVRLTLTEWALDELVDTAMLLTSEVVTNAVLHARTPIVLSLARTDDGVRVSVADDSPVTPAVRTKSATATTGRGIRLLQDLAEGWSTETTPTGKVVWFTLTTAHDPWAAYAATAQDDR